MILPTMSIVDGHWTVMLDPFEQPEFFVQKRSKGSSLNKEFRGWLQENDPKHYLYQIQIFHLVRFGSEDAAMLFRLKYGAKIRRSEA